MEALRFDDISLPPRRSRCARRCARFCARISRVKTLPDSDFNHGHDAAFSAALGRRGWIGMTWPKRYGGGERTFFERYVVTEELLAAGAPVSAHWIADRQSGPLLLRYGTEAQRERYLPPITRGESYFSIGMSEPDSGSDLASVRTSAARCAGRLRRQRHEGVDDRRASQSLHHRAGADRARPARAATQGLTQLIIDLHGDGVKVRPIRNIAGDEDFNEVVFTDCFVPDDQVVGRPGNGWEQVTSELSYERSGPERFLSAFRVLVEFVRARRRRADRPSGGGHRPARGPT